MATKGRAVPGLRLVASARTTWDIGSTGTLTEATTTVDVPQAKVGDSVLVNVDTPSTGFQYSGYVSAASVVTLRATNCTTGTVNPASTAVSVMLFRP